MNQYKCSQCDSTDAEYVGWNGQGDGDGYSLCCNERIEWV